MVPMLTPPQTYYPIRPAGLVFPDLLLMSLSVWFTLHLHFLFLNYLKMELPLVTKICSCAPKYSPFQLVWLATQITFFSFSYWYCSLSNQLWLQTSLRTPTSFDFIKCPPYNLRQGRPFTALDGYSFRLPPSHQSTPHKWPDSPLPPTQWLDIPHRSKVIHTLLWRFEKPAIHTPLLSRLLKFTKWSNTPYKSLTAENKPWSSW